MLTIAQNSFLMFTLILFNLNDITIKVLGDNIKINELLKHNSINNRSKINLINIELVHIF